MTYVERQRQVCRPVYDTTYVQRTVTVCRPVSETTTVTQNVTVCRPETTTQQVTDYCLQPTTQLVTVPVAPTKCGHCGKVAPACGCATVAQTCYTPVPVRPRRPGHPDGPRGPDPRGPGDHDPPRPRDQDRDVPVRTCRIVTEVVTDRIPVTNCPDGPQDRHPADPVPGLRDGHRDVLPPRPADGPGRPGRGPRQLRRPAGGPLVPGEPLGRRVDAGPLGSAWRTPRRVSFKIAR